MTSPKIKTNSSSNVTQISEKLNEISSSICMGDIVDFYNLYQQKDRVIVIDTRSEDEFDIATIIGSIRVSIEKYNMQTFTTKTIDLLNAVGNKSFKLSILMSFCWREMNLLIILPTDVINNINININNNNNNNNNNNITFTRVRKNLCLDNKIDIKKIIIWSFDAFSLKRKWNRLSKKSTVNRVEMP